MTCKATMRTSGTDRKISIRILGDVGSGKSAVYAKVVAALADAGATVIHARPEDWRMIQNAGEADSASEMLYTFSPEVTMEEVCLRTNAEMSKNQIMQFFTYAHLPEKLQRVSRPFALLAQEMDLGLPDGPEKSVGLRKLLEAKDAMVRALLQK